MLACSRMDGKLLVTLGYRWGYLREKDRLQLSGATSPKAFVANGVHPRTTNKDVTCLSSFWRWLEQRGHVENNVGGASWCPSARGLSRRPSAHIPTKR
jgi:hypothetical protein